VLLGGGVLCVPAARPQSGAPPIRVESGEVAVPTFVYDKKLHPVSGLGVSDFRVTEDRKEQNIQHVAVERIYFMAFRDNFGVEEREWAQTRGQKWSILNRGPFPHTVFGPDFYILAYTPLPSSEGACHSVKVRANRSDLTVYFRDEYCNTPHPVDDPLYGTKLSKQMERNGASGNPGKLRLSLQAGFFDTGADTSRVYVTVEFPPDAIKLPASSNLAFKVAILTTAFRRDGTPAGRSSDLYESYFWKGAFEFISRSPRFEALTNRAYVPNHHETQVQLPPGDYDLRVVVSDGEKFGVTQLAVTVPSYDEKQLDISSLLLCRQFHDPNKPLYNDPPWAHFSGNGNSPTTLSEFAPLIAKGVEFTPAGDLTFSKKNGLFLYYEVYRPLIGEASAIQVQTRMRIINTITGAVETDTGVRSAAEWMEPGKSVIRVSEQVAGDKLEKGSYRIEVQASDSAGRSTPWRTATFTVE